eukprot:15471599-Alexandrium_andersonii.AAC.1
MGALRACTGPGLKIQPGRSRSQLAPTGAGERALPPSGGRSPTDNNEGIDQMCLMGRRTDCYV